MATHTSIAAAPVTTSLSGRTYAKPVITKTRYAVTKPFDYLTADRQYDFEVRSNSRDVNVRRIDGSGIGCYIPMWQFKRALNDGSLSQVSL